MAFKKDEWEDLANDAIGHLSLYLKSDTQSEKAIPGARIAATVLSAYTRFIQTEGAREAARFMMAREITSDPEKLAEYVRVSVPDPALINLATKKGAKQIKA